MFAQNTEDIDIELQSIIEVLIEENEELAQFDTYVEQLTDLYDNKISVNKGDYDDFQQLVEMGIITGIQLNKLLDYREQLGKLVNQYELQAVPLWDLGTIRKVLPFVDIRGDVDDINVPLNELLFGGKNELYLRYTRVLEEQKGYIMDSLSDGTFGSRYLGSPDKMYMRYRYKFGSKLSYGVTAEKDAGEQFYNENYKKGFDFYSAHFYIKDLGPLKHLVVGDYSVTMGQGLTAWTGLGFGKSPFVMDIKRQGANIAAYTSVNENLFLRGAAAVIEAGKNLEVTTFGSRRSIDVTFGNSPSDTLSVEELFASGITEAGLHRTKTEFAKKNNAFRTDVGGEIKFKKRKGSIGLSGIYSQFSIPVSVRQIATNQFRFSGDRLANVGLNYRYLVGNFHFFGETAISDDLNGNQGFATLNGVLASLHPQIDVSVLYRKFSRNYQTLWGTPFGESSTPVNEDGLFVGTIIRPTKDWTLQAYTDFYRHEWFRFRVDGPSFGHDKLLQLTYRPSRSLTIYGRYFTETKGRNLSSDAEKILDLRNDLITGHRRQLYRIDLRYKPIKEFTLKSRIDVTRFDDGISATEKGFMVYQEVSYAPLSFPISFDIRYILFDIDSWDARIYAYEKDVLYAFSIPPYSDRGRRFYIVARYNVNKQVTAWVRFARTSFDNRDDIGSGNELIVGKTRSEVKAQLRIKF